MRRRVNCRRCRSCFQLTVTPPGPGFSNDEAFQRQLLEFSLGSQVAAGEAPDADTRPPPKPHCLSPPVPQLNLWSFLPHTDVVANRDNAKLFTGTDWKWWTTLACTAGLSDSRRRCGAPGR